MAGEDVRRRPRRARRWSRRGGRGAPARGSSRRRRGRRRAARPARQGRRWTPCHPHTSHVFGHFHPAVARRRARAHDRFPRPRRQRRRPPRGLRRVRGRRRARRPRARRRRQGQEGVRGGARDRDRRAVAGPRPRGRRPSRRAVAGAARTSASSRSRPSRSRTRCARIGRLDGFELEPIVPAVEQWRYRNKVEFSFGTGDDGELVCGFHAPGRWNEIVPMADCKLVSERVNELREQVLAFCRDRATGRGTGATTAASCATSSSARAAAPARRRSG